MKDKRWVQHVSGQGEKWEVLKLTLGGDDGFARLGVPLLWVDRVRR